MIDVDDFKLYSDTYGHLAGDEVLRETAIRLLSSVPSFDFVGRYGGEEFLVVLNNCNPACAFARAEEIRKPSPGLGLSDAGSFFRCHLPNPTGKTRDEVVRGARRDRRSR